MNKQQLIEYLKNEGFSENIVSAFSKVKREDFISKELKKYSYENGPLPIGEGQTISQPYTIAFILDLLKLDKFNDKSKQENSNNRIINKIEGNKLHISNRNQHNNKDILIKQSINDNINKIKILEIGSGSGYVLALIHELTHELNTEIYGIERIKSIYEKSKKVLKDIVNIKIFYGDGSNGLVKLAPFDRILISAAAREIPENLFSQLKDGGILVCPVRNSIYKITKTPSEILKEEYPGFIFVPLIK